MKLCTEAQAGERKRHTLVDGRCACGYELHRRKTDPNENWLFARIGRNSPKMDAHLAKKFSPKARKSSGTRRGARSFAERRLPLSDLPLSPLAERICAAVEVNSLSGLSSMRIMEILEQVWSSPYHSALREAVNSGRIATINGQYRSTKAYEQELRNRQIQQGAEYKLQQLAALISGLSKR